MSQPAPRERIYAGFRKPGGIGGCPVERVEADGSRTPLPPRFDLRRHSPDGFQWGYTGSGPAQLALALAADATGDDDLALRVYQDLKDEAVAWLADRWQLGAGVVADLCHAADRRRSAA